MMPAVLIFIGALTIVPIIIVLDAWVLSIVWAWFMVPIFAAPVLSVAQAIGVSAVISLFRGYRQPKKENDGEEWKWLPGKIMQVLFVLLIAYLAKQFI